jgi:periplasmic divalent cation tolerance protein
VKSASIVLVTVPNRRVAQKISESLLQQRLAACVSTISNVTSRYLWNGKLESAREFQLVIKTRTSNVPSLIQNVKKNHPYETPEIISLPIRQGYAPYLKWIENETSPR